MLKCSRHMKSSTPCSQLLSKVIGFFYCMIMVVLIFREQLSNKCANWTVKLYHTLFISQTLHSWIIFSTSDCFIGRMTFLNDEAYCYLFLPITEGSTASCLAEVHWCQGELLWLGRALFPIFRRVSRWYLHCRCFILSSNRCTRWFFRIHGLGLWH